MDHNQQKYEEFVSRHPQAFFTQSLKWGKVKAGWKTETVMSFNEQGESVGSMLLLIRKTPALGYSMMYSPRGPVCDYNNKAVVADLLKKALEVGKKYNACSLKIDPPVLEEDTQTINLFKSLGFHIELGKKDFETVQIRNNYVLRNLRGKTEDEVIMSFKQKTRYNIRVAIKHGVECKVCDASHIPEFYELYKITAKRDNFIVRPMEYYSHLLQCFGEDARLYLCYYNGKAISGSVCISYANRTYYLFGASDNEYRNVMPNYLMQWEMIRWCLQRGCDVYDFMGIPISDDPSLPMHGVYRFKKGFNGDTEKFAGEFDFVIKGFANNLINTAISARRGLSKVKKKLKIVR